jgi:toxin-antitoxin system PIN domain toxin
MKLLSDTNVLLALVAECHSSHMEVLGWWEGQVRGGPIYVCRPVQMGLLRLMSSEAALGEDAVTLSDAWAAYATLLASGRFAFTLEPQGIDPLWERFCRPFRKSPKVVMDAYLAAFAKAGGYRLVTLDAAFVKFPGLDHEVIRG